MAGLLDGWMGGWARRYRAMYEWWGATSQIWRVTRVRKLLSSISVHDTTRRLRDIGRGARRACENAALATKDRDAGRDAHWQGRSMQSCARGGDGKHAPADAGVRPLSTCRMASHPPRRPRSRPAASLESQMRRLAPCPCRVAALHTLQGQKRLAHPGLVWARQGLLRGPNSVAACGRIF